jgi:hypothetical protein
LKIFSRITFGERWRKNKKMKFFYFFSISLHRFFSYLEPRLPERDFLHNPQNLSPRRAPEGGEEGKDVRAVIQTHVFVKHSNQLLVNFSLLTPSNLKFQYEGFQNRM